jgi:benzoate 4-monooxygenase
LGKFFPEGAVLSVPIYTIHRDPDIWGDDVEAFWPERWFELDQAWIQEMFYPFSYGPRSVKIRNRSHAWIALTKKILVNCRACVARNVAMVTLRIFIATIFRRYTFVLEEDPTKPVSNLLLINPPVN